MSGAISTHIGFQHMDVGAGSVLLSPGMVAWLSGTGSQDYVQLTNPLPGPPPFENPGADTAWRAYRRVVSCPNSVTGTLFHVYHGQEIYSLTASPNWSLAFSVPSQNSARGWGDHTGLYHVLSRSGDRVYLCALYRRTDNSIGWVKFDTLTNTWTAGALGLGSVTEPFSVCLAHNGRLLAPVRGGLVEFDPETDSGFLHRYVGNWRDWITVVRGRVFIVTKGGGASPLRLRVLEWLGGAFFVDHGYLPPSINESTGASGGWSIFDAFTNGRFYVPWYSAVGGSGWLMARVIVGSATPGALDVTLADITDPVIPDGVTSIGNYRYPGGTLDNSGQQLLNANDGSEWPLGAFGTTGGVFSVNACHMVAQSNVGTRFGTTVDHWAWGGESVRMEEGSPSISGPNWSARYSYPASRWGSNETMFPDPANFHIESAQPFSDGTVSRGLLILFRSQLVASHDVQFLTSPNVGDLVQGGDTPATLSVGDGIAIGGTATLDVANRKVVGVTGGAPSPATLYQIIWDLDADSVPAQTFRTLRIVARPNGASGPPAPGNDGAYRGGATVVVFSGLGAAQSDPSITSSPVVEAVAESDQAPAITSSPVVEAIAETDASPAITSSPVVGAVAEGDLPPQIVSSPVVEAIAEQSPAVPNLARQAGSSLPYMRPGGVQQWQSNAGDIAVPRPSVNFQNIVDAVGFAPGPRDSQIVSRGGDPLALGAYLASVVELGRVTIDAVNDPVGTLYDLVNLGALGETQDAAVVSVIAVLRSVSGFVSAPDVGVGTSAPYDQQAPIVTLTGSTVGKTEIPVAAVRQTLKPADTLRARLVAQASAGAYVFDLVAYGVHRLG